MKLRFEVFKRDNFTCQYCGNKPPEIILEVDHIKPVSKGGDDNIINLLTSCYECNRGKSNIEIIDIKERPDLKIINSENLEKELQLQEYYRFLSLKNKKIKKEIKEISNHWEELSNFKYSLNEKSKISIKKFLEKLTKFDIIYAMDESIKINNIEERFKYFCGVCWRMIKGD